VKQSIAGDGERRVILVDSITELAAEDAHAVVVSGSHGGVSAGEYALAVPLAAAFFNDAGVGKDAAGIAALEMLQRAGVAAGAVAHTSARIGDAQDTWDNGVVSHVNAAARALGFTTGASLRSTLLAWVSGGAGAAGGRQNSSCP
jgi:hypothetical protein